MIQIDLAAAQRRLALDYASKGLPVFPVNPPNKRPYTPHGYFDATTDERTINGYWDRWRNALVALPTGPRSGFCVLDVDGEQGRASLGKILAALGLELPVDLGIVGSTPSGGLHIYSRCGPGEEVKTRAGDIAPGIDTRGLGGYIIAPGNSRPDGKGYRLIDDNGDGIFAAGYAPRELVYLGTFNRREREAIMAHPKLRAAIREALPAQWSGIMQAYRDAEADRLASRRPEATDGALRRQALHDINEAAREYAGRKDGRRNGLFSVACKVARYAAHRVISEQELRAELQQAAMANGALSAHGHHWFNDTLRRALAYGARDALPIVARRFVLEAAA